MLPGVRPSISLASLPTASTSPVSVLIATAEGSSTTIPRPLTKTRVLVVPKSMPRLVEKRLDNDRRLPVEIPRLPSRSTIQIRRERTNNYSRVTQREPPARNSEAHLIHWRLQAPAFQPTGTARLLPRPPPFVQE